MNGFLQEQTCRRTGEADSRTASMLPARRKGPGRQEQECSRSRTETQQNGHYKRQVGHPLASLPGTTTPTTTLHQNYCLFTLEQNSPIPEDIHNSWT